MTLGPTSRLARRCRHAAVAFSLLAMSLVPLLHHHEFGAADYPGIHAESRDQAPHPAGGPCLVCLAHHQKAQVADDGTRGTPPPFGHRSCAPARTDAPRPATRPPLPPRAPPAPSPVA